MGIRRIRQGIFAADRDLEFALDDPGTGAIIDHVHPFAVRQANHFVGKLSPGINNEHDRRPPSWRSPGCLPRRLGR